MNPRLRRLLSLTLAALVLAVPLWFIFGLRQTTTAPKSLDAPETTQSNDVTSGDPSYRQDRSRGGEGESATRMAQPAPEPAILYGRILDATTRESIPYELRFIEAGDAVAQLGQEGFGTYLVKSDRPLRGEVLLSSTGRLPARIPLELHPGSFRRDFVLSAHPEIEIIAVLEDGRRLRDAIVAESLWVPPGSASWNLGIRFEPSNHPPEVTKSEASLEVLPVGKRTDIDALVRLHAPLPQELRVMVGDTELGRETLSTFRPRWEIPVRWQANEHTASVSFSYRAASSAPATITVHLDRSPQGYIMGRDMSQPDERFLLDRLLPGRYRLGLSPQGQTFGSLGEFELWLAAGTTCDLGILAVEGFCDIQGQVIDSRGQGVLAQIEYLPAAALRQEFFRRPLRKSSDPDGRFLLRLPCSLEPALLRFSAANDQCALRRLEPLSQSALDLDQIKLAAGGSVALSRVAAAEKSERLSMVGFLVRDARDLPIGGGVLDGQTGKITWSLPPGSFEVEALRETGERRSFPFIVSTATHVELPLIFP